MFLLNSCLGLFSAACSRRHPFSRTYGVNLPSSLTAILPPALGFSPHLPVSVCGTGTTSLSRCFSWKHGIMYFGLNDLPHHASELCKRICLSTLPRRLDTLNQRRAQPILLCPHFTQTTFGGTGISTCCPSPTALALGLGPD